MSNRFVNLFKKTDLDEQQAFQKQVLQILKNRFPERNFVLADDPRAIVCDENVLGLTNLKANFLLSDQTDDALEELIAEQFSAVFNSFDGSGLDRPWGEIRSMILPQLMPEEFLEKMPLAHFPFGDGLVLAFVVDSEKAYSYVRTDQLDNWGINADEFRTIALENLHERSQGIEMVAVPGDGGLFVINTMDGFDAVRILNAGIQELIGENIGSPFYAAVPNRDFFICWSKKADADMQSQMRANISNDFEQRPYPLSRNVFEVSERGAITLSEPPTGDARSLTAELN